MFEYYARRGGRGLMRQYIVWSPHKLEEGVFFPCKHSFFYNYPTSFPSIHSCVFFILSFHDLRDSDASCSHLSAVKTDTGFEGRWRRGHCEPCWVVHSLHRERTKRAGSCSIQPLIKLNVCRCSERWRCGTNNDKCIQSQTPTPLDATVMHLCGR